jgi:hypothetical protein
MTVLQSIVWFCNPVMQVSLMERYRDAVLIDNLCIEALDGKVASGKIDISVVLV